jgi:DNA-binding response OmpR family regulator
VLQAKDGAEGLALLRAQTQARPKLVLLDLMMPDMDGWQFRAEQLRDAELAHIPVVILSAVPLVRQRLELLAVADSLVKPFDVRSLLATVERCSAA